MSFIFKQCGKCIHTYQSMCLEFYLENMVTVNIGQLLSKIFFNWKLLSNFRINYFLGWIWMGRENKILKELERCLERPHIQGTLFLAFVRVRFPLFLIWRNSSEASKVIWARGQMLCSRESNFPQLYLCDVSGDNRKCRQKLLFQGAGSWEPLAGTAEQAGFAHSRLLGELAGKEQLEEVSGIDTATVATRGLVWILIPTY